jgi:MoaA/NifB/PqqE/SkfB family radical SAM enzyme
MGKNIFGKLFSRVSRLSFFAWQVELTTRCPLRCRMCLRDSALDWVSADMPIDSFRKLVPYFKNVKNVVLEGWGEPLLYPDLLEAVKLVKGAEARAGFVTSGWGLERNRISDLIEAGLDFIGFSLAGANPATHQAIRINSDFPTVIQAIQDFNRIRADRKLEKPNLHIVFLMLKDNLYEIPLLLNLAKEVGIRIIVLINLAQVTNVWQNSQKVFTCGKEEVDPLFREAEIKAGELGIILKKPGLSPEIIDVCEEDPLKNLYISVDGQVAPCVYLYPPVPSPITRIFCDRKQALEKVSFGNIFSEPLEKIWNNPAYAAFRQKLIRRKKKFAERYSLTASLTLGTTSFQQSGDATLPDFPEPCRTCHRMLGL